MISDNPKQTFDSSWNVNSEHSLFVKHKIISFVRFFLHPGQNIYVRKCLYLNKIIKDNFFFKFCFSDLGNEIVKTGWETIWGGDDILKWFRLRLEISKTRACTHTHTHKINFLHLYIFCSFLLIFI